MPVVSTIELPRDQYAHIGAPKEWWWHIGTVRAGDRVFGFEVNVTGLSQTTPPIQYAEMMITDVQNQKHYQFTGGQGFVSDWAQSDPSKSWYVRLSDPDGTWDVSMTSKLGAITTIALAGSFADAATGTRCTIALELIQNGPPLLVWGTGVHEVAPSRKTPLERNNYYYSFTRLAAKGTFGIGTETFAVAGETWMDHEYGAFPGHARWILQDAQLDNGYHLSNFIVHQPVLGERIASHTTVLTPEGDSVFVEAFVTPLGPQWTDPEGQVYCLTMQVDISEFDASLTVRSLMADQEFAIGQVYEAVSSVNGTFGGRAVTGTGWIEQILSD